MIINAALIAFTGLFAVDQTWSARIWIFISTATGLYMSVPPFYPLYALSLSLLTPPSLDRVNRVKLFVAAVIPDVPQEVEIQLQRQDYILGKVLDNIQDEDDDELLDVDSIRVPDFSVKYAPSPPPSSLSLSLPVCLLPQPSSPPLLSGSRTRISCKIVTCSVSPPGITNQSDLSFFSLSLSLSLCHIIGDQPMG
jgi:hypothetical protein